MTEPGAAADGLAPSAAQDATASGEPVAAVSAESESVAVKAKIFAVGLLDIGIDLVLPTLVYLALTPTGRSAAVRLSVGGFAVAAKSVTGRVREGGEPGGMAEGEEPAGRPGWHPLLLWVLLAGVASVVTLGLAFAGAGDTVSVVAGTLVLAASVVPVVLRRHRIDGFALLVLAEVATSVLLIMISDDPRLILARPAVYTAIAGVYAIATGWTSQPFMMEITRPMAAGGNPVRAAAFDHAWITSASFRRAERGMTYGLGVVLIAEAVLRVVAVYSQPEGAVLHASLLSQLPSLVLFVGYVVVVRVFVVPIASREVDAEMPAAAQRLAAIQSSNTPAPAPASPEGE